MRLQGPVPEYFTRRFSSFYGGGPLFSTNFYFLIRLCSVFCLSIVCANSRVLSSVFQGLVRIAIYSYYGGYTIYQGRFVQHRVRVRLVTVLRASRVSIVLFPSLRLPGYFSCPFPQSLGFYRARVEEGLGRVSGSAKRGVSYGSSARKVFEVGRLVYPCFL